jgi:hypothetical protein
MPGFEGSPSRRWLLPAALVWSLIVLSIGISIIGFAAALKPLYSLADLRVGPAGFGAFIGHAILCGSDNRRKRTLRLGVLLEVIRLFVVIRSGIGADALILSIGYGFLLAALIDFALHREWRRVVLAVLVPLGMTNAAFGLQAIVLKATPLTYDGALYALDGALNVPISRLTGEIFNAIPFLAAISLIAYALLPGGIAAGLAYEQYSIERKAERGVGANLLLAYTISGTVAAIFYLICPGTGPAHAFPRAFPHELPSINSVSLGLAPFAPHSPRNAMPSFHFIWAVLLYRSTLGARRILRLGAALFALFTIFATIGSGEHYVVDLIVGIPVMVALEAAAAHRVVRSFTRVRAFTLGGLLYAVWMTLVRAGQVSIPFLLSQQGVMWTLALASLAAPLCVALRRYPMTEK